jgi:uncharacterized membrane protein YozB (DUF420 family)
MTVAENLLSRRPVLRPRGGFPRNDPRDRLFYPLFVGLIWFGVVAGFGPELAQHIKGGEAPYPLIVHLHAATFTAWVVLLMAQSLLIRTGQWRVHRRLGLAAIGLAALMLILGPAVAIAIQRAQLLLAHPSPVFGNPAFLAVQLEGMLGFGVLVTAGFLLRSQSSAHRRLMLLATLSISDAGFARFTAVRLHHLMPAGYWADFAGNYAANDVLILILGAYDLITRRRLHPAWVAGASYLFVSQFTATALLRDAAWKVFALHLINV